MPMETGKNINRNQETSPLKQTSFLQHSVRLCTTALCIALLSITQIACDNSNKPSAKPPASNHYQLSFRKIHPSQADNPDARSLHPYSFIYEQQSFSKKIHQRIWRYLDYWHHLRSVNGQTLDLLIEDNTNSITLNLTLYRPATTYGNQPQTLEQKITLTPEQWTWIVADQPEDKIGSQIKIQRR